MEQRDNLLSRLDRLLDWIKSCDTKASIVIAGVGLFLTIMTSEHSLDMLNDIFTQAFASMSFGNLLYLLFFGGFLVTFVIGAYNLIKVLIPSLRKDNQSLEGIYDDSLYFFEGIAKNNYQEFAQKMRECSPDEEIQDLLTQIYINARICTAKYTCYGKGIKLSFIGVAGLLF